MPQKHEIYGLFYSFSKVFAENVIKNILQEMNLEWTGFETATITSDNVLHKIRMQKRMHIPRKNEQYFYFSLTLKDTEIVPKLLFDATLE